MTDTQTVPYNRLKAISTQLQSFDCKQSSLVLIENLFFEALSISRNYSQQLSQSHLIDDLLEIKENEYKRTQEYGKTTKAKEAQIRHFRYHLKKALDKSLSA